ncbi:MAG TPA: pentapeptide repeat-containing protein [Bacteriovoracaceae bacterium]|nr:pentapeptide repeat-containing protein [Bacteriovoracaceae bacterium]
MNTQTIEMTQFVSSASYQLIQDEKLAGLVITSQTLSSSFIEMSSYQQVVFSDCVFHACEFKGVTFNNCVFENCNFEFSHMRHCKFINCNFTNCNWIASTSINSTYEDCDLDKQLQDITHTGHNLIHFKQQKPDYSTDIYFDFARAC